MRKFAEGFTSFLGTGTYAVIGAGLGVGVSILFFPASTAVAIFAGAVAGGGFGMLTHKLSPHPMHSEHVMAGILATAAVAGGGYALVSSLQKPLSPKSAVTSEFKGAVNNPVLVEYYKDGKLNRTASTEVKESRFLQTPAPCPKI